MPQHVEDAFRSSGDFSVLSKSTLHEDASSVLDEAEETALTSFRADHDPESLNMLLDELEHLQAHVLDLVNIGKENEAVVG
eukprot:scaffold308592_cov43-Prasinocladus_malaysianus.AAC.1